ncbi:MFS transporter [Brevibacillus fortis]|uniref:MFS transporter n=1 Tax=Brevibacillus fortis TaxID=2126352 RepID=A0A2P7V607_9BACL|nr:MFS transporter [Brevibacillus fortis]PSJ94640.1 MFS transporter [Brevibacillus fortis]
MIQQGTPLFRKTSFAFFAAGFNTFAILYCVQPLLPEFSKEFTIDPTTASLSLSITTMVLAISMLIFGSLSEVWGRKPIMIFSMLASSVFCILTAFSSNFHVLLVFRTIEGISLAGLPSIAMAYLGEEIESKSLGAAMGLYICGNSIGAVFGRVFSGMMSDYFGWHIAIGGIGLISLAATLIFWNALPPSQNFKARPFVIKKLGQSLMDHLKAPGLVCLFVIGFILLGTNVALFNYIAYVLLGKPYSLSQAFISWTFFIMIIGMFSSVWIGKLVDRHGKQKLLFISLFLALIGVCLTWESNLIVKIGGLGFFTFGFFGAHSVASSWVGQLALQNKAQASSLYLFFYYTGSSVGGTLGGLFWSAYGWGGVISMNVGFLVVGFILWAWVSKMAQSANKVTKIA